MKLIDTHIHTMFPHYAEDREAVLHADKDAGVRQWVQIGCDEASSLAAIDLAKKHPGMWATVGLHPCDVMQVGASTRAHTLDGYESFVPKANTYDQLWAEFDTMITHHRPHVVGIGETGFDHYHQDTPKLRKTQYECFVAHLELAKKHSLPLVFHVRHAFDTFNQALKNEVTPGDIRGIVHCFSAGEQEARYYTHEYGFLLGIGGLVTYPSGQSIRDAVAATPIEYLVTETDGPFLPPQSWRTKSIKRNTSASIVEVIRTIADIKNISVKTCAEALYTNGCRIYGLTP